MEELYYDFEGDILIVSDEEGDELLQVEFSAEYEPLIYATYEQPAEGGYWYINEPLEIPAEYEYLREEIDRQIDNELDNRD